MGHITIKRLSGVVSETQKSCVCRVIMNHLFQIDAIKLPLRKDQISKTVTLNIVC